MKQHEIAAPDRKRIMSRTEASVVLNCTARTVDRYARDGILRRVILPGHDRSIGFLASEVEALLQKA